MTFTSQEKAKFKEITGEDSIPQGELVTSGSEFEKIKTQLDLAIAVGALEEDTKFLGFANRYIREINDDGTIPHNDLLGVIKYTDGGMGLLDGNGIARYSKEQTEAIKSLISLV